MHHRLLHLVLTSCLESPIITLEDFHELLHITDDSPLSVAAAMVILGREFTPDDLDEEFVCSCPFLFFSSPDSSWNVFKKMYMYSYQDELLPPFYDVPLIRTLLDLPDDVYAPKRFKSRSSSSKNNNKKKTKTHKSGPPAVNRETRRQEETTVVTERVGVIAQRLYNRTLAAANQVSDEIMCVTEAPRSLQNANLPSWPVHDTDVVIKWGKPNPNGPEGYYLSVFLDEIEYRVGKVSPNSFNLSDVVNISSLQSQVIVHSCSLEKTIIRLVLRVLVTLQRRARTSWPTTVGERSKL
jgi:DNA (cytosine-5)-methyltransferase 1